MYMVSHTAGEYLLAASDTYQFSYVCMEARQVIRPNRRTCGFDVKYQVYVNFT